MILAVTGGHSIMANISRMVLAVTGVTVSRPTSAGWYWQLQVVTVSRPTSAGWYWQLQGSQYHGQHQQSGTGSYRGHSITANISRVVLSDAGESRLWRTKQPSLWSLKGMRPPEIPRQEMSSPPESQRQQQQQQQQQQQVKSHMVADSGRELTCRHERDSPAHSVTQSVSVLCGPTK